jgi:hypothetical protein
MPVIADVYSDWRELCNFNGVGFCKNLLELIDHQLDTSSLIKYILLFDRLSLQLDKSKYALSNYPHPKVFSLEALQSQGLSRIWLMPTLSKGDEDICIKTGGDV